MEANQFQSLQAERCTIAGSLTVPRMINGLWQLAGGHDAEVDISTAAEAMKPLIDAGLWCFDMADHYGEAEVVVGQFNATALDSQRQLTAFTKWCPPEDGKKSFKNAEAAVDRALGRMGQKTIALMQYHIWDYSDDTYLHNLDHLRRLQSQGKIQHLGLTNTDAAHLKQLLQAGFCIATNQVSCSVIDRRVVQGDLASVCAEHGVGILAYGTLLGGFLSEKWLVADEPRDVQALNWSLRKYLRFIHAAGGWAPFQRVLRCLASVAEKHKVAIAAVATRWVLDIPVVSAVIVGCRLSADSLKYASSNLMAFSFALDDADRKAIEEAQRGLKIIPGDCGDEYRRPPYLTATGDLSHHLKKSKAVEDAK
ncbi:Aldo/keto reductase [Apiospora saccharicola]|uniref:Aldo/keto reductase n=1 Tax=Apiospora saccharicola TaxID=335842 RepID=A0ABR1TI37_9PEZI